MTTHHYFTTIVSRCTQTPVFAVQGESNPCEGSSKTYASIMDRHRLGTPKPVANKSCFNNY
eukprot:4078831-Amphidinium_carterae.2